MRRLLAFLVLLAAACNMGDEPQPSLECGPNGQCPDGYVCRAVDRRCYRGGALASAAEDAAVAPDDAAADVPDAAAAAPDGDLGPLPRSRITASPPMLDNEELAELEFAASTAGATFACRLDGGAWAACASPDELTVGEGEHVFEVRATDPSGRREETPAAYRWTVDLTPPETSITGAPDAAIASGDAALRFSSSEPGGFLCDLDGEALGPCASPLALVGLAEGDHDLEVRALDAAGNVDPTPARASWRVVLTGAAVVLSGRPAEGALTDDPQVDYAFTSAAGASFECSRRGEAFAPCTSPVRYRAGDGAQTFAVRARDALGNEGPVAARHFTLDTIGPAVVLAGTPAADAITKERDVHLTFTSEAGASFECSLDGATFAPCRSPVDFEADGDDGEISFLVRATDAAGNVGPEALRAFTLDTKGPTVTLTAGPAEGATVSSAAVTFAFGSEPGARFSCSLDGAPFAACASPLTVTVGGGAAHAFAVTATDAAGNPGPPVTRNFRLDREGPAVTLGGTPGEGGVTRGPASFVFTSEPGATFACSLDGLAFTPCASPRDLTVPAPDGDHTFAVRATDALGNAGPAATLAFSLDSLPPEVALLGTPADGAATRAAEVALAFTTEAGAVTRCQLDADPEAPCASPLALRVAGDGPHGLVVTATDAAGNRGSARRAWTVDTVAPAVTLSGTPADEATTSLRTATFSFASEPGATFACARDGGQPAPCTSPLVYDPGADGAHTFAVVAIDAAGNGSAPATRRFTIDTTGAAVVLGCDAGLTRGPVTCTFASEGAASFGCSLDGGDFTPCASPLALALPAPDGAHTLAVRAADALGNLGASETATIIRDTTPPALSLSGLPGEGAVTRLRDTAFTFSAESGATLACSIDGGAAAPCASPLSYPAAPDGAHTFTVTATDAAGNGAAATRSWSLDTAPPTVTLGGAPADGATVNVRTTSFTFAASETAQLACSIDGGAYQPCASPVGYDAGADGPHRFAVVALDAAGNLSAPATRAFILDTTGATALLGCDHAVTRSAASCTFTSEAGATFRCSLDGAAFTACASPAALALPAPDGPHTFAVRAADALGNVGAAATATIVRDTTPPLVSLAGTPADGATVNARTASFTFSASEPGPTMCSVDGAAFQPCASPVSYDAGADGAHTFAVVAGDAVGNVSAPASRGFTLDTAGAAVTLACDRGLTRGPVACTFGSEAGASFACSLDGAAFTPCTSPDSFTLPAPDGPHTFTVRASDALGNAGSPRSLPISRDTVPPPLDLSGSLANGAVTKVADASFTFVAESGASLACQVDAQAPAPCASPFAYHASGDGPHSFTVTATDAAGNVTSARRAWTLDTIAPVVTLSGTPGAGQLVSTTTTSFTFTSEAGVSWVCSLDLVLIVPCSGSVTASGQGSHTFVVRATDAAGNSGIASRTWSVDTVAPVFTVEGTPADGAVTRNPDVQFAFSASESVTFLCVLDGVTSSCASPLFQTVSGDGTHQLFVQATDAAGNRWVVSRRWTLDTTGPVVTIAGPGSSTQMATATFSFNASEPHGPVQLWCKVGPILGGSFAPCSSPFSFTAASAGTRTLYVYGVDALGNQGGTATYVWTYTGVN